MSKVKYIKSARSNLVYAIERSEYKTKFRTPENYFKHAERATWVSLVGFNTFVMYRGTWYSVGHTDHGYITILEFVEIDAEQAAEIETAKAYKAMTEANEHEQAAVNAAIEYDAETAKKEAQEARFSAAYAKTCAKHASEYAAEAGISTAAVNADIASEYAAHAANYARSATETAERAAVEAIAADMLEEYGNAEDATNATAYGVFADMHDGARPDDLEPADMEQMDRLMTYAAEVIADIAPAPYLVWEDRPETETPENYAAEDAATSLINAYSDAIGERPLETDPEARAAYRVAGEEIAGCSAADASDREIVAAMVEAIAQAVRNDMPTGPDGYRPTYQRHELESYLGEPDDYDVTAIEHDATAYDPETGRTVWAVDAYELAAIAERHQLQFYAPAF